jgi:hypothetical protein
MVVAMKITVFWDMGLCSLVEAYCCFRGTHCLHSQGQKVSEERNM